MHGPVRVLAILAALAALVAASLPLETEPRPAPDALRGASVGPPGASWAADGHAVHPVPFMPIWAVLLLSALLVGSFGVLVPRSRPRDPTGPGPG
jgi:hypothetical protein